MDLRLRKFCTPRYLILRELDLIKLRWSLRARRYEKRLQLGRADRIVRECWREKKQYGWRDRYVEEKEKYLNRIGWDMDMEMEERIE